jgi:hypothetical protein
MLGRRFTLCVLAVWMALQVATTAAMSWVKCCPEGHGAARPNAAAPPCHPEQGGLHDHHAPAASDHHAGHAGTPHASEQAHHTGNATQGPVLRCLCGISADTLGILLNAHAVMPDLTAPSAPCAGRLPRLVPFFAPDHRVVVDSPPPRL